MKATPGTQNWFSAVEPAQVITTETDIKWDDEADLVIAGYGGAGVAAAVEGVERGLKVIAIDRYHGGGATSMNGGVVYLGGGTKTQQEAGVSDTPQEMFKYLQMEVQGVVSDKTLQRFCDESPALHDWLTDHGVQFNSRLYKKKTSYPNTSYYLYHSDSSLAPTYAAQAKPAARGHRVYMQAGTSATGYGIGLYDPLKDYAAQRGVTFLPKSEVRRLVMDQAGRVLGVVILQIPPGTAEAAQHDKLETKGLKYLMMFPPAFPGASITRSIAERYLSKARALEQNHRVERFIRARKGVCLSAGGFIFNRPMVSHYAPNYDKGMPLGSPGDDGSGIRLGQTAGGAVERLSHISAWRFINPPHAWAQGIIVDDRGERYVNETLYGATLGYKMCEEHRGRAYLILDAEVYKSAWQQTRAGDILPFQKYPAQLAMLFGRQKAKTLDELAKKCGFDPQTFRRSVAANNRAINGGATDSFGKAQADIRPIEKGPFYAIDMSIDAKLSPLPTLTLGGLKVDEDTGQVLNESGNAITGLYAAGRNAIGICSNIYVSGLSASDCIFSGRRAAIHIATQ